MVLRGERSVRSRATKGWLGEKDAMRERKGVHTSGMKRGMSFGRRGMMCRHLDIARKSNSSKAVISGDEQQGHGGLHEVSVGKLAQRDCLTMKSLRLGISM